MTKIEVNASTKYTVTIDNGAFDNLGELLLDVVDVKRKLLIVTDCNVSKHYLKKVVLSLQKVGYKTFTCILDAGEETKNIENFSYLCSVASVAKLNRNDVFIALGGGVIGDLVGFASACFMRGVDFIQLPTTMLAAIDSSVGGKTGVNIPEGKNLVGCFHQPLAVFYDSETYKTLDQKQVLCGLGEAIKYAVLLGGRIYEILAGDNYLEHYEELVELCVIAKAKIVEQDEKEHGQRKLLNLGHTLGHVIERNTNFRISHGQAVVKGLYLIIKAQLKEGSISQETFDKIYNLINKYGYDLSSEDITAQQFVEGVSHDKKTTSNGVWLIKVKEIGDCYAENVSLDQLGEFLL